MKAKYGISRLQLASPLWKLARHMRSHSVTCHPAEVTWHSRLCHQMAQWGRSLASTTVLLSTCRTDAGSDPPPLNSLTFRPVVGQLSEVVPFLLLEQRCGIACQAKLRRPRRCRCSKTGWRHTCSAAATKLFDFELHFFFSHYLTSRTVDLAIVFTV